MNDNYQMLEVNKISYDPENPRIKEALGSYKGELTDERIQFALSSVMEETSGTSSYSVLKDSIRSSKGAMVPITVIPQDGEYMCIDGNTRLAIHKDFLRGNAGGCWDQIKALVLEKTDRRDIERSRIVAHLLGARLWPAYEKAKYLNDLRENHYLDYGEMIALCGGDRADIECQINAYHDMNEYYHGVADDPVFHLDKFSYFVELQEPAIKEAIFQAGLNLKDFGEWLRDDKICRLADVRNLPAVLGDDEARKIFLEGGLGSIEEATKFIESKNRSMLDLGSSEVNLQTVPLYQLVTLLTQRIRDIKHADIKLLRDKEHSDAIEQVRALGTLSEHLKALLQDVSE